MVMFTKDKGTMTEDKYTKTENKKKDEADREANLQKLFELVELFREDVIASLASFMERKLRNGELFELFKKKKEYYYDSDGQDPGEKACPRKKKRY